MPKAGHDAQTIPKTASANGWYIGRNIISGRLIGWFIVDPQPEAVAGINK